MYDDNNMFAKILRGEMPAFKVFEDERALAFMDAMPQSDGHTLVMPKARGAQLLRHRAGGAGGADQGDAARRARRAESVQSRRHAHHAVQREPSRARRSFTSTSTSFPATKACRCATHNRDWATKPCSPSTPSASGRPRPTCEAHEDRRMSQKIYKVPEDFAALAHLKHADYQRLYQESVRDPHTASGRASAGASTGSSRTRR